MSPQQFDASPEPSKDKDSGPPSASRCTLLSLPLEILEKIFDQTMLDSDSIAWAFVGPSSLFGNDTLALCPVYTSHPTLAHVDRYICSTLLASLSRTMTFRIDSSLSLAELKQSTPWFSFLDSRQGCGIRRLQVRLAKDDSAGKKANLNLRYFAHAREWKVELVPDQGFAEDTKSVAATTERCKPSELERKMLKELLKRFTPVREGDIQGLSWDTTMLLMRMVHFWYSSDGSGFRHQSFQDTVSLPKEGLGMAEKEKSSLAFAVMAVNSLRLEATKPCRFW